MNASEQIEQFTLEWQTGRAAAQEAAWHPMVSVVLPTYNRAATLARAIDSVFAQTYSDFEILIVDDGSTDSTGDILRNYECRPNVRIIRQPNSGAAHARNTGIRLARGTYIAFQESDDEWEPTFLECAVGVLRDAPPDVAVFYCDMMRVLETGVREYWPSPTVRRGVLINEETLDYQVLRLGLQATLVRRACLDVVGLFDEALPRYIDLELFIRLSEHYEFLHHPEPLVRYYAGEGISTNARAQVVARRHIFEKYRARLGQNPCHFAAQKLHIAAAEQQETIAELCRELRNAAAVIEIAEQQRHAAETEILRLHHSRAGRLLGWYRRTLGRVLWQIIHGRRR